MGFGPMCVTTKRILKKLGGDKIPGKVLTNDGSGEKVDLWGDGSVCVKISPNYIDVNTLTKLTLKLIFDGHEITRTITKEELTVVVEDGFGDVILKEDNEEIWLIAAVVDGTEGLSGGVYFYDDIYIGGVAATVVSAEFGKETIHPIDSKYLPNKVVDFDELGITNTVLELFNAGGGDAYVVEDDVNATEVIWKAFPLDGDYVAKFTIPNDGGTMYVKPVYTSTYGENGMLAHFDSYLEVSGELKKFYVRLGCVNTIRDAGVNSVTLKLGFYA